MLFDIGLDPTIKNNLGDTPQSIYILYIFLSVGQAKWKSKISLIIARKSS